MNKAELRKKMIFIRDSLSIEERKTKSHAIKSHLTKLKAYQDAEVVFVYVSFRSEVDTRCFIKEAKKNGKRIAVPISIPKGKCYNLVKYQAWMNWFRESGVFSSQ